MYGELGSVQGIVDLSPEEALNKAEAFLASQDTSSSGGPTPPLLPRDSLKAQPTSKGYQTSR
jgi:hypothetical protein